MKVAPLNCAVGLALTVFLTHSLPLPPARRDDGSEIAAVLAAAPGGASVIHVTGSALEEEASTATCVLSLSRDTLLGVVSGAVDVGGAVMGGMVRAGGRDARAACLLVLAACCSSPRSPLPPRHRPTTPLTHPPTPHRLRCRTWVEPLH